MMNLVYFQRWPAMEPWHCEIDLTADRGEQVTQPAANGDLAWAPHVDLHEEDDRFVLRVDVPGVAPQEIEVSADASELTIRGERLARPRAEGAGAEHIERSVGAFLRRFTLPESVRAEAIKARCSDGVLEIEIPKQPRVQARRISVAVN